MFTKTLKWAGPCLLAVLAGACAGSRPVLRVPVASVAPTQSAPPLVVMATRSSTGALQLHGYDAQDLFKRANLAFDAQDYVAAARFYGQLLEEFPDSGLGAASRYNLGLAFAHRELFREALNQFDQLLTTWPEHVDSLSANFQAAELSLQLEDHLLAMRYADRLLARGDLGPARRVEAMSLRARGQLGAGAIDDAARTARNALFYYRRHRDSAPIHEEHFAAASNFVLAESLRLTGQAIELPADDEQGQRRALGKKAEKLIDAQRAYFDTIRLTDSYWAGAAGYQIGSMYDAFWAQVMSAPVPGGLSEGARGHYPQQLALLVKPLLRHAIRYWELTLAMAERTRTDSGWVARIKEDLVRVKARLAEQPAGPGGLPREAVDAAGGQRKSPPVTSTSRP